MEKLIIKIESVSYTCKNKWIAGVCAFIADFYFFHNFRMAWEMAKAHWCPEKPKCKKCCKGKKCSKRK